MSGLISPVCSNRPRPSVQTSRKPFGNQWWKRDVYHAAKSGMSTYCGRDSSEWLRMDPKPLDEAICDDDFCTRCAAKLKAG